MAAISQQFIYPSSRWNVADYNKPIGPIGRVIAFVAAEYSLPPTKLKEPTRLGRGALGRFQNAEHYGEARDVARWLARIVSGASFDKLGAAFKCKGETAREIILKVDKRRSADAVFRVWTDELLARAPR